MISVDVDWPWALTLRRALAYLLEQRIERHHLGIYTSSYDIFRFCVKPAMIVAGVNAW